MRERYSRQLQVVYDDLLRMGSRVEHALADAMKALAEWDVTLASRVIAHDQEIDQARSSIEEAVLDLLATQQPVLATDLRALNATIAITSELERAGDYAKGIAKRVERCLQAPVLLEPPPTLFRMGSLAQQMLHTSLDAFVRLDVELARSLAHEDERVDELEETIVRILMDTARANPVQLDSAIYLLDIVHTLERLADRTTNIAERVIFIATNVIVDLNG